MEQTSPLGAQSLWEREMNEAPKLGLGWEVYLSWGRKITSFIISNKFLKTNFKS